MFAWEARATVFGYIGSFCRLQIEWPVCNGSFELQINFLCLCVTVAIAKDKSNVVVVIVASK